MYISESIYYLLKEVGFLFLPFSYSAFLELMRRTSSQKCPHGITGMILRTRFVLIEHCVWRRQLLLSSCQKIMLPLQTANQQCKHALMKRLMNWWGHRYKAAASAYEYKRNPFFGLLLFFFVVSRLSSNTLRERPGSRGADTAEFNSEPWKSEGDKRLQNACEGGSSLPLTWLKSEITVRKSICEL